MTPRDVTQLAFTMRESAEVPYCLDLCESQAAAVSAHYGSEAWKADLPKYVKKIIAVDNFMSDWGLEKQADGTERDRFGCVWKRGAVDFLVTPPLAEASLSGFQLPDVKAYYRQGADRRITEEAAAGTESFRVGIHSFGLFERAWSLRGFEPLLMDFYDNPEFCDDLLESIACWMLESVEAMLKHPLDAILLTDDYADQRGMIFGLDIFRRFFKPRWKRIFGRIHEAGVYTVLHVCGNAEPALGDLIECGLDCVESVQPEAMDVYRLKKQYGEKIRFWGGLGIQGLMTFGKDRQVREEVSKLKRLLGSGGGYILSTAKEIDENIPLGNVVAYFEEARRLTDR
jgi:uroporphyrinogen decarboxylase